jgi:hypothetical protein
VTIYYEKHGDEMVVTRVVSRKPPARVIERNDHYDYRGKHQIESSTSRNGGTS